MGLGSSCDSGSWSMGVPCGNGTFFLLRLQSPSSSFLLDFLLHLSRGRSVDGSLLPEVREGSLQHFASF
jgi:hypothetical protein